MSSMPLSATQTRATTTPRPGDATVVRGVAAFLVLLALVAILAIPGTGGVVAAVTIVAGAVGLFAAASWRRPAA